MRTAGGPSALRRAATAATTPFARPTSMQRLLFGTKIIPMKSAPARAAVPAESASWARAFQPANGPVSVGSRQPPQVPLRALHAACHTLHGGGSWRTCTPQTFTSGVSYSSPAAPLASIAQRGSVLLRHTAKRRAKLNAAEARRVRLSACPSVPFLSRRRRRAAGPPEFHNVTSSSSVQL